MRLRPHPSLSPLPLLAPLFAILWVLTWAAPLRAQAEAGEGADQGGASAREADGAQEGSLGSYPPQTRAWTELGYAGVDGPQNQVHAGILAAGIDFRLSPNWLVQTRFGVAFAAADVVGEVELGGTTTAFAGSTERVFPANPTFGALYVARLDARATATIGLGVGVPTAARAEIGADSQGAVQRSASDAAYRAVLSGAAFVSVHRWAPERLSIFAPIATDFELGPVHLQVRGQAALLLPVLGDRGADPSLALEVSTLAEAHVVEGLRIGGRVQVVGETSDQIIGGVVFSIQPHVALDLTSLILEVRAPISLSGAERLGGERGPGIGVFLAATAPL